MNKIFTYLFLFIPFLTFAQSNYKKGSVTKTDGETLKGYIDYQEWERNTRTISFKTAVSDKETLKLKPVKVQSFEIEGLENYISYEGRISMDQTKFPDLPTELDTTTRQDTVFLRELVSGSHVTLFYHADNIKTRFFIAEKGSKPVELIFHQIYQQSHDGSTRTVISAIYRDQLSDLAHKYVPEITSCFTCLQMQILDKVHW